MKAYEEYERLQNEIQTSPGFIAAQRIKQFQLSVYVMDYNYKDLKTLFDKYKDPILALALWQPENADKLLGVQMQIQRYFSNYVSAALYLVAHARKFMKSYSNSEFSKKYAEMINSCFDNNGLHKFLQDLRNYIMHYQMPFALPELKFGKLIDNDIYLIKSDLLKWAKWTKPPRDWLDTQQEKISFSKISDDYYSMVKNFYDWFFIELNRIHRVDLDYTNALMKRSNELLKNPDDK